MPKTTEDYIKNFDIDRFETLGSDFTNPKYSPYRLGKALEDIDVVYDYDFEQLEKVEKSLAGIDRRRALNQIFEKVTEGSDTDTERHLRVLEFLQKASFHNYMLQPMYPDGVMVYDPLVLLELGEMRCGQVNRIAVDIFRAAGYDSRLVQAGGMYLLRYIMIETGIILMQTSLETDQQFLTITGTFHLY